MKQLRKYVLFISLLLPVCSLLAQQENGFYIKHYDNGSGLSNSAINKIYRDRDDILWIGTWDGLNRFDGNEFKIYNYNKAENDEGIGNNVVREIAEDASGNIWVSTIEGISKYSKTRGKFTNYFYNTRAHTRVSEQEFAIAIDTAGIFYCFSTTTGFNYYDEQKDTLQSVKLRPAGSGIKRMHFDELNHLWLLTTEGTLEKYSLKTQKRIPQFLLGRNLNIRDFFMVNNRLLFTTDNFLFELDQNTGVETKLAHIFPGVNDIVYYANHYILSGAATGLQSFNDSFRPQSLFNRDIQDLQELKVTSLSTGDPDILWLGTDGNGVVQISPKTNSFKTVVTSGNSLFNKAVRSFCTNGSDLWIGTKGNGILIYKDFLDNRTHSERKTVSFPELDNNAVYALKRTKDDVIYIGSDGEGLTLYDIRTKRFTKWQQVKGAASGPPFKSVYAILEDADGSLWLGTSGHGLIHLKIERELNGFHLRNATQYTFNNSSTGPSNDIIYSLAADGKDSIWIGCRYGGLDLFDKKTKTFHTFKSSASPGSLSNNDVLSVFVDSRGQLWVGTSFGLNILTQTGKQPEFKKLTTEAGLPSNTIHAIVEDAAGLIWVSTNKGLARINPNNFKSTAFHQSDGLQSDEFCDGAVWQDNENRLFFGGVNGFNYFAPHAIQQSRWHPKIILSHLTIGGKAPAGPESLVIDPRPSSARNFIVSKHDNSLELIISPINYLNPEKCEFAWQFYDKNRELLHSGTTGKVNISNISPGSYKLIVKWSNGEGVWTNEVTVLTLQVKQSPWLTTAAFFVYFLLVTLAILAILKYHRNKTEIKKRLELEHSLRTQEEEIHKNRLIFFTNIAHELQTPLTLIMGSVERKMENQTATKHVYDRLIHQQASKLTYLVQQVLEFRKAESGYLENQFCDVDLSKFLLQLTEPFYTLAGQLGFPFEVSVRENMRASIDKDKVERIVYNLLSNAFRHGDKHQEIRFFARLEKNELFLEVSNGGTHVDQAELEQVFEQFYSSDHGNHPFGTGIGLAFTRQLLLMLQGNIHVQKENDRVCFRVTIPVTTVNDQVKAGKKQSDSRPSLLFQTITDAQTISLQPASNMNKQAVLEDLFNENKKKVLIVEDEPEIRYLLRDILKGDYIVFEADNGLAALDILEKEVPALVISDVMMPGMNGLELCSRLKNSISTCHIPFILLSAKGSDEQHLEGYGAGADAYIGKPFNASHLKIRIKSLLGYREKLHRLMRENTGNDFSYQSEIEDADRQFLHSVVAVVRENLDSPEFNTAALEKALFMSKMQLYRKLKSLTDMTPGEFIKSIRLKEAAQFLKNTNLTVLEIFYKTGFNNQSYFFREFRKAYDCTPNEFREQFSILG